MGTINILFYGFFYVLLITSLCVVFEDSVKFSAIWLMLSFFTASLLLILLESEFLGLLLIIIYVGAIAILFLFAIMLTETKFVDLKKTSLISTSAPAGVLFGFLIYLPVLISMNTFTTFKPFLYTNPIIHVNELIVSGTEINDFGGVLYSYYAIPLLLTGVILLVILLGVFRLTDSLYAPTKHQSDFKQLSRSPQIF
jgi:NADH-quinone oxidoreductase subunit J